MVTANARSKQPLVLAWTSTGLVVLAVALAAYPALRLFWDFEIDYNEGWNAYHQLRAIAGVPLYLHAPFFYNNYPPLSFYLVGALGALLGDPVRAGRLVSLIALVSVAGACYAVVRSIGAARAPAALAFATCLGAFARFAPSYVAMNDPQLLGHAFLCAGLLVYVRARTPRALGFVPVCFALGLLTKHNLIALPVVVSVQVAIGGTRRERVVYFGSALACGPALALSCAIFGLDLHALFRALTLPRSYDLARARDLSMEFLRGAWLPILAVGLGLGFAREQRLARSLAAYLSLALVSGVAFAGGAGVDVNVFFDVLIAVALGTGVIASALAHRARSAFAAGFALGVNAVVIAAAPMQLAQLSTAGLSALDRRERTFRADVAYLRAIDGPAICESLLLCLRAGKPIFYDPFNVLQATATGRLANNAATRLLEARAPAVVELSSGPPVDVLSARFANFSLAFFETLDRNYVMARSGGSGRFYLSSLARDGKPPARDATLANVAR